MADRATFLRLTSRRRAEVESMRSLHTFSATDALADRGRVRRQGDAWRIDVKEPGFLARSLERLQGVQPFGKGLRSVRLFELEAPGLENGFLVYRARMKTQGSIGRVYLELLCHLSEREYYSRGHAFRPVASETTDWPVYETPFLLEQGQAPGKLALNVAVEGTGSVFLRDVQLLIATPRDSHFMTINNNYC